MIYPHQWRFLVSASVYADMMLHLMKEFDWKKIAVIQDVESYYYSGISANFLLKELNAILKLFTSGALYKLEDALYEGNSGNRYNQKVQKLFSYLLMVNKIAKLLCMAGKQRTDVPKLCVDNSDRFVTFQFGIIQRM